MAWNSRTNWGPSDNKPTYTDLNSWGLDLRTWGGNVDAGGYNLTNLGSLSATTVSATAAVSASFAGAVGINTVNPTFQLEIVTNSGTNGNVFQVNLGGLVAVSG